MSFVSSRRFLSLWLCPSSLTSLLHLTCSPTPPRSAKSDPWNHSVTPMRWLLCRRSPPKKVALIRLPSGQRSMQAGQAATVEAERAPKALLHTLHIGNQNHTKHRGHSALRFLIVCRTVSFCPFLRYLSIPRLEQARLHRPS